ncbi:uncharacterized protein PFL1_03016 [Pseudozyma flocculosa PF-1]|uniref:MHYT domain-containing protein n=2 Tax=Pseudozyma flocculosa TaxID=84751 RepID=A0A5C3EZQ2_9BASI|nr:uncharacterized protein PFL1_03016 [Pseudozyma flocculosa PF-1]EPQ29261.1 hypothetical protein PFL1_03016 [Pseudozyma flocculosa PF-1]SPO37763.1 uncharacterized protein PSFLO_03239 [Pseudozyma flocculosa]
MAATYLVARGLYSEPKLPDYLSASNMTAVAEYYTQHRIPQRFSPGIVFASVAVAALGSYATLLVLGKRTGNKGLKNMALLSLAATTMASVGIWGMHFIGMYMSLRPIAGVTWYIKVNPGFTVLSLFVPLVALLLAFFIVDAQVSFSILRTSLSGILVGLIVSLMHYSASLKTNFTVIYSPAQVVASIVVACIASTVALVAFFKFRAQWEDSWWKRILCALILAGGVSGMHYIGVWGTSYQVPASGVSQPGNLLGGKTRNNVLVIAIASMCAVIVIFSIFIGVSDLLVIKNARSRAKKVVVCSATFDKQGRLLVKPDGTMPLMIIETDVNTRDILEALDNRQPTFQWLYSLSWDWHMITPWLKAISARFLAEAQNEQRREAEWKRRGKKIIATGRRSLDLAEERRKGPQSLADFRDRFIYAANQLADELAIPFEDIGVLYDHVLPTGTRHSEGQAQLADKFAPSKQFADDESSINGPVPSIFGDGDSQEEGAMLFLVRELPGSADASTERFRQRGYRMTETRFLAGVLADRVAVKKDEMEPLLESLKVYSKRGTRPVVQPGGVYAGLFGVRASTSKEGGLDVLVYNFARHQIPAYRLPDVEYITPEMKTFLGSLDQATMEDAMKICERESIRSGERRKYLQSMSSLHVVRDPESELEQDALQLMIQFQTALFIALDALHNSVRFYPKICQTARISAEVLEVPSSLDDMTAPAEMILVQAVLPEARAMPTSYSGNESGQFVSDIVPTDKPNSATPFVFIPYTLFSKSQMMLLRGRQADDFEHEVMVEMRRRYPSSLQSEAEEKGIDAYLQHKDSMISSGRYAAYNTSDDRLDSSSGDEKDLVKDHYGSPNSKHSYPLPTVRRWASRLSNDPVQRTSREDAYEPSLYEGSPRIPAEQRDRRTSAASVRSPQVQQQQDDVEMRGVAGLRAEDQRSSSPSSTVARSNSFNGQNGGNGGSSLGIRRFILEGGEGQGSAVVSQGRFAHPADDTITEETASATVSTQGGHRYVDERSDDGKKHGNKAAPGDVDPSDVYGYPMPPPTPNGRKARRPAAADAGASALSSGRTGSRQGPSGGAAGGDDGRDQMRGSYAQAVNAFRSNLRPSTAPTGGRRELTQARPGSAQGPRTQRPRTGRAGTSHGPNPAQDEGSVMARLQSDGWYARQIQSLEKSPAGTALLGVDF